MNLAAFFDTAVAAMTLDGTFRTLLQLEGLTEDGRALVLGGHQAYVDDLIDRACEPYHPSV